MLLYFLTAALQGISQQLDLVKKYANDTTGFTTFPETPLLENLRLPGKYTKLEINTWTYFYASKNNGRYKFKNVSHFPADPQKLPDTIVLSKCDLQKCFTACWCPGFIPWYISAQTLDNKTVTVGDTSSLKAFLGSINNQFNARLWLSLYDKSLSVPNKTYSSFKYKKVKDGYLISYNTRIANAPATYADVIYFIGSDFRVILLSKKHIVVTNYMI